MLRLISMLFLLALLPATAVAQDADLERELDDTRDEREAVAEELEETRAQETDARALLAQIDGELDQAEKDLAERQEALELAEQERDQAVEAAAQAAAEVDDVRAELARAEEEFALKQDQLHTRIRSAYMYGQMSIMDAFTGNQEFVDLLNTTTYVTHVMDADRTLVERVEELVAQIDRQRLTAEELQREADAQADEAQAATLAAEEAAAAQAELTSQVRQRREERAVVLEQLRTDRAAMEGHLAGLEEESARIEAELAEIARQQEEARRRAEEERRRQEEERLRRQASEACEAARQAGDDAAIREACGADDPITAPDDGPWIRPVSGRLTSPFGPRWGRNHNGVDLSGNIGTLVVSAKPGTVVTAVNGCHPTSSWGCGGGFGNYVTVVHGDGMATVYAHLSSVRVGSGDVVISGEGVGEVGNSGNSYGPHLHFETRKAGVPQNPCGYISC